jgi:hypothetical protein
MALTITAASAATHIPAAAAPPPKAGAPEKAADAEPSAASAAASRSQQQATLNRLLVKYAHDQSQGADARTLSALGKQIMAAAKALGQHVTLPNAPASSSPGLTTQPAGAAPAMVNVTA